MRSKPILFSALCLAGFAIAGGTTAFAQTAVIQNRVSQPVVINNLRVDAAYVLAPGGGIQSYTCPAPQQYVTPDGASQGWACFDSASNVWLLSALPPQQAATAPAPVVQQAVQPPVYQQPDTYTVTQPTVIYQAPPRVVYAAPYYYPYYAPYYYPRTYYSPSLAIGVASINAGGRIASAIIESSRFHDDHRNIRIVGNRGRR